jgi:hypothetical protein
MQEEHYRVAVAERRTANRIYSLNHEILNWGDSWWNVEMRFRVEGIGGGCDSVAAGADSLCPKAPLMQKSPRACLQHLNGILHQFHNIWIVLIFKTENVPNSSRHSCCFAANSFRRLPISRFVCSSIILIDSTWRSAEEARFSASCSWR